jgi:hypothetical protein
MDGQGVATDTLDFCWPNRICHIMTLKLLRPRPFIDAVGAGTSPPEFHHVKFLSFAIVPVDGQGAVIFLFDVFYAVVHRSLPNEGELFEAAILAGIEKRDLTGQNARRLLEGMTKNAVGGLYNRYVIMVRHLRY